MEQAHFKFEPADWFCDGLLRRSLPPTPRSGAWIATGGSVLMEPGDYGFSSKFAWLNDRFGESWPLNFA